MEGAEGFTFVWTLYPSPDRSIDGCLGIFNSALGNAVDQPDVGGSPSNPVVLYYPVLSRSNAACRSTGVLPHFTPHPTHHHVQSSIPMPSQPHSIPSSPSPIVLNPHSPVQAYMHRPATHRSPAPARFPFASPFHNHNSNDSHSLLPCPFSKAVMCRVGDGGGC
jgi:hypothetical protein